jgi:hypothetical protein
MVSGEESPGNKKVAQEMEPGKQDICVTPRSTALPDSAPDLPSGGCWSLFDLTDNGESARDSLKEERSLTAQ